MCAIDHSCLRVAPQGERDGAPAKHLPFPLSREEILELHITKQRLGLGHEIQDQFVTTARGLYNHLFERVAGSGGLGTL